MNSLSTLSHTHDNQMVLRELGAEITNRLVRQERVIEGPSLWDRICSYFPTTQALGYKAGEHLALTYGAQWSNASIDFVVRRVLQEEIKPLSYWTWEGVSSLVTGAARVPLAETLKLSLTPKALPYIAIFMGTTTAIALPTLVSMVSLAYRNAMHDPRKLQQLSELPLNQLFTVDADTGRLRDAFGRLMSSEDMKDIFREAAKYDFICRLIDLCHMVDQKGSDNDALNEEAEHMLKELVGQYVMKREDGQFMFQDGTLYSLEKHGTICEGIGVLKRTNPTSRSDEIRRFINLIAEHSLLPMETLSSSEAVGLIGAPKRIPALFSGEDHEWKNGIVRTEDGKYVVLQDSADKKRGALIEEAEMEEILADVSHIQREKAAEKRLELDGLLRDSKGHAMLAEKLSRLSREEIKAFLMSYVTEQSLAIESLAIESLQEDVAVQVDNSGIVFANGDPLSADEWQKFQQDLALLPSQLNPKVRLEKILDLVKQVATHLPVLKAVQDV